MGLSPPFLFLHLLADRKLNPAGLLVGFGDGDADLLLPLNASPDFLALPAALPCLVGPKAHALPPAWLQALLDAGYQLPAEDSVLSIRRNQPTDLAANYAMAVRRLVSGAPGQNGR